MPDFVQLNENQDARSRLNGKIFAAGISGGATGAASLFGMGAWLRSKLRDFEFRVQDLTRHDILNRTTGMAGVGAGIDARGIEERHRLFLINTTPQNIQATESELAKLHVGNTTDAERKLAKFIYNIGGKGGLEFIVAAAAAIIVALPVFLFSFRGKKGTAQYSDRIVDSQPAAEVQQPTPAVEQSTKQFAQDVKPNPIDPASIALKSEVDAQPQR